MQHDPIVCFRLCQISLIRLRDLVAVLTVSKAQIFERLAPPLLTSQEPLFLLYGHHDPWTYKCLDCLNRLFLIEKQHFQHE